MYFCMKLELTLFYYFKKVYLLPYLTEEQTLQHLT